MVQKALVLVLFIFALSYILWLVRRQFHVKNNASCSKGCGCSAVDVAKLEQKISENKTGNSLKS